MFIDCYFVFCRSAWNIGWASCVDVLLFFMSDWLPEFVLLRSGRLVVANGMSVVLVCCMCCQFNRSEDNRHIVTLLEA